ncbi:MAG TPA: hypothetical protein VN622_08435 [Clostridia bacterium]|nr:hypothetical protein [Clostridia bacterium]
MREKKLYTAADYLAQAEQQLEERYPGSLEKIRQGKSILVIQEQAIGDEYDPEELALIGSVAKVAAHHGNVVVMVQTNGVLTLGFDKLKPSKESSKGQA